MKCLYLLFGVCLLFFTFYILFVNLGKAPLDNWDEAWYGEMIRQMLRSKDLIVLHWNQDILLDKPPLFIWIGALSSILLGISELAIRLPSAISALLIILIVTFWVTKKWGIVPGVAAWATLIFNNVFIWRARSGNIDVFLTWLILLTFILMISKYKYKYLFLGILMALIFLTKATIVLFPFSIFIVQELLCEHKKYRNYLVMIAIMLFIPALWLIIGSSQIGSSFYQYYLFNSDQGVANINLFGFKIDYWQYAYYSLQRRYFYVFMFGLAWLVLKIKKSENLVIFLFSVSLLFLLSFTQKNNNWYLVPSMPFWSITIGLAFYQILILFREKIIIKILATLVIIFLSYRTYTINIIPILNTSSTLVQKESGLKLKEVTSENEKIVRLDHLYPATVYYADRKILASPVEVIETKSFWISRSDVINGIQKGEIKWLVGERVAVQKFMDENKNLRLEEMAVNPEESIIRVTIKE